MWDLSLQWWWDSGGEEECVSRQQHPSSATIVSNEFSCQLQLEGLDRPEWYTATVALLENVGGDSNIEQKIKNIRIKLSALHWVTVVASNLVTVGKEQLSLYHPSTDGVQCPSLVGWW